MRPLRSLLFVPAHRDGWVDKGVASGADGLIIDLEDSVPADSKVAGRAAAGASIARLHAAGQPVSLLVRVNPLDTGLTADDLGEIVRPGLDAIFVPKIFSRDDIIRYDTMLEFFEARNGVAPGSVEIVCGLETAESYACCESLLAASPRVATLAGGTARDADVSRSLGFQFTAEGLETLYLRSRTVLAVRASGRDWPLISLWQEISDLEGLRTFAEGNRRLGFRGQLCIHPTHVPVINDVYTPSRTEVDYYAGMIEAFEGAEHRGLAAIDYEGTHVDYAHIKTAREVISLARSLAG